MPCVVLGYCLVCLQLKSKHAVSGSGNSTLNQNRRPVDDDDDDIPSGEGGVESDRQAARIGGEVVYDEDDRLDFVRQSKYAEYYAYIWLLFEKLDMLNSVESSLDTDTASTMTNTPRVRVSFYKFCVLFACVSSGDISPFVFFLALFRPRRKSLPRAETSEARVVREAPEARAAVCPRARRP